MNPLYTLCAPNGVHTNTLQANTTWFFTLPITCVVSVPKDSHITLVFSSFILRPLSLRHSFHFLNFSFSSSHFPTSTRSSAYSISHGRPSLSVCVTASITIMKNSGLSTEPWYTPTFTPNHSLTDPSYDLMMFCLPSLESNVSACFFITSACTLAIHLLASFLDALYSACFTSFSHSSAFFHSLNFCLLVSTTFSTSSHHHQVSLCLHLPFVTPQTVAATSVIAFSTLSHCFSTLTLSSISIFLSCNFSNYAFLISCFFSFHTLILGCTLFNPDGFSCIS